MPRLVKGEQRMALYGTLSLRKHLKNDPYTDFLRPAYGPPLKSLNIASAGLYVLVLQSESSF